MTKYKELYIKKSLIEKSCENCDNEGPEGPRCWNCKNKSAFLPNIRESGDYYVLRCKYIAGGSNNFGCIVDSSTMQFSEEVK